MLSWFNLLLGPIPIVQNIKLLGVPLIRCPVAVPLITHMSLSAWNLLYYLIVGVFIK